MLKGCYDVSREPHNPMGKQMDGCSNPPERATFYVYEL